MCFSEDNPPSFNRSCDDFQKWKRKFGVWRTVTEKPASKQGGLLILSLDDVTQGEVLDLIDISEIKKKKGVNKVLNILDEKFQKEASITAYEAYQEFESCRRSAGLSISDHCDAFNRKYVKFKNGGSYLSEHVLALKLLDSSNLSDSEVTLIKATVPELTYDEVFKQLKKTYIGMRPNTEGKKVVGNTLYNETSTKKLKRQKKGRKHASNISPHSMYTSIYPRKGFPAERTVKNSKGRNPIGANGIITRCNYCESINHRDFKCPDLELYKSNEQDFKAANQRKSEDNITYEINFVKSSEENKNTVSTGEKSIDFDKSNYIPANVSSKVTQPTSKRENEKMQDNIEMENKTQCCDKIKNPFNPKFSNFELFQKSYRPRCYNCNNLGHISPNCPKFNFNKRCFNCNTPGHSARHCLQYYGYNGYLQDQNHLSNKFERNVYSGDMRKSSILRSDENNCRSSCQRYRRL